MFWKLFIGFVSKIYVLQSCNNSTTKLMNLSHSSSSFLFFVGTSHLQINKSKEMCQSVLQMQEVMNGNLQQGGSSRNVFIIKLFCFWNFSPLSLPRCFLQDKENKFNSFILMLMQQKERMICWKKQKRKRKIKPCEWTFHENKS